MSTPSLEPQGIAGLLKRHGRSRQTSGQHAGEFPCVAESGYRKVLVTQAQNRNW